MSLAEKVSFRSKLLPPLPNISTILVYFILQGFYLGYINQFWQHWLVLLGFSVAIIGLLEAGAGAGGVLPGFLLTIGGKISDRIGRRKLILLGSAFFIACWSVSTISFFFNAQILILLAYILWSFAIMGVSVVDAILADTLPTADRSRVYSVLLIASTLPSALTGYLAGEYSNATGPQAFLALATVLELFGFVLLYTRLKNIRAPGIESPSSKYSFGFKDVYSKAKRHWGYFSVGISDSLTWGIGTAILSATLTVSQNFTNFDFGLITITMPVGILFGTLPGGWFTHHIGPKKLLAVSQMLGGIMMFGWAFYPVTFMIPIYGIIWGFAISTWIPVQFLLSSVIFPAAYRGELMGAFGTSRGLIRAVVPIIATVLFLIFGYSAPLLVGGVGVLLSIGLIVKFIPNKVSEGAQNLPGSEKLA